MYHPLEIPEQAWSQAWRAVQTDPTWGRSLSVATWVERWAFLSRWKLLVAVRVFLDYFGTPEAIDKQPQVAKLWLQTLLHPPAQVREKWLPPGFHRIDDKLWRGPAPHPHSLRALLRAGLTGVVSLIPSESSHAAAHALGLEFLSLAISDGGLPGLEQVREFAAFLKPPGVVLVHSHTGGGRATLMSAIYRLWTGLPPQLALLLSQREGERALHTPQREWFMSKAEELRASGA